MRFTIVDVFADGKYTGNQLAVFRGNPGGEMMLRLANEMNFAETTFITSDKPENGGYNVRIFTRATELPYAGHPTLGTAYIIAQDLLGGKAQDVTVNLKVGPIPVRFDTDGIAWMSPRKPEFGKEYASDEIAATLGVYADDMSGRFPVQDISTGIPFLVAPLKTLEAVQNAKLDGTAFLKLTTGEATASGMQHGILIFAPETIHTENNLHARVLIVDRFGVWEDPATGSANGCLAAYLAKHRYMGSEDVNVRVEQGYQIGRPSLLFLNASDNGANVAVEVGGRVGLVARGELAE